MAVFGTNVPLTKWTALALLAGIALTLLFGRALANAANWRTGPTVVALLSLTALLALTMTPDGDDLPVSLRECVPLDLHRLAYDAIHTGGGKAGVLLNGILPAPFTAAAVIAGVRVRTVLAVAVLLPGVIELSQTLLPGRHCAISDYLANTLGGIAGVGVAWMLRRRPTTRAAG